MTQDRVQQMYSGPNRRMNRGVQIEPKDALVFFLRHYRLVVFFCVAAVIGAIAEHRSFPKYRAKSTIYVDRSDANLQMMSQRLQGFNMALDMQAMAAGDLDKYVRYLNNYDFFLTVVKDLRKDGTHEQVATAASKSQSILDSLKLNKNSNPPTDEKAYEYYLGDYLKSSTTFSPLGLDGIIITITSSNQELSRSIADGIAKAGLAWIAKQEMTQLDSAVGYIDGRIREAEENIARLENDLVDFKNKNNIFTLNGDLNIGRSVVQEKMSTAKAQLAENSRLMREYKVKLDEQTREIEKIMRESGAPAGGVPLKTQISEKLSEVEASSQVLRARIEAYKTQIEEGTKSGGASVEQEAYDFKRKFEFYYSLYSDLLREKFRVELNRVSVQNRMRNITKADYSEVQRAFPLSRKLAIALLAAMLVSCGLAYLYDIMFPVIRSRSDLSEMGFVFLGGIQDFGTNLRSKASVLYHRVRGKPIKVFRFEADSLVLSSIFKIRSKIMHNIQRSGKESGVIAFVGASAGDGKTFSATNCAAALANLGKRTLLVDTDLRASGTSKVFEIEGLSGLVDVMEDHELFGKAVLKNPLPNLDVLGSGRKVTNPTEIMTKRNFKDLVSKLSVLYDFVILDTPPILLIPETMEIEKAADYLIFVTSYNRTKVEDVIRACDTLLDFGLDPRRHMAILNRMDPRQDSLVLAPSSTYYQGYGKSTQTS